MTINVIAVDCATQDSRVGLCLAEVGAERLRILQATSGKGNVSPLDQIVEWIARGGATIVALDAPLGWPFSITQILPLHKAGEPIEIAPDRLFRRRTDLIVEEMLGKRPLEVGADRIARTALSALRLLSHIGEQWGQRIPLAWDGDNLSSLSDIEVYPAATLRARAIQSEGYRGKDRIAARLSILKQIQGELELSIERHAIASDDHLFDALICSLAAFDFLKGDGVGPTEMELARKEGWIWFKRPALDTRRRAAARARRSPAARHRDAHAPRRPPARSTRVHRSRPERPGDRRRWRR